MSKPLHWDKPLRGAIVLKDGRELSTLRDLAEFVASLPRTSKDGPLEYLLELLLSAADTGKPKDIAAAASQMEIVLRVRALID